MSIEQLESRLLQLDDPSNTRRPTEAAAENGSVIIPLNHEQCERLQRIADNAASLTPGVNLEQYTFGEMVKALAQRTAVTMAANITELSPGLVDNFTVADYIDARPADECTCENLFLGARNCPACLRKRGEG